MTGSGHKILCLKRHATYYILWHVRAHLKLSRSYAGNFTSVASRVRDEGGLAVPFEGTTPFSPSMTRTGIARRVAAVFDH